MWRLGGAPALRKGPAPGPISNTKLLDARQGFRVPLPGQKLKEHYRGVGMEVDSNRDILLQSVLTKSRL
eukprot:3584252-Amphidinium_carterae.1